jgi:hypothetical protein
MFRWCVVVVKNGLTQPQIHIFGELTLANWFNGHGKLAILSNLIVHLSLNSFVACFIRDITYMKKIT